MRLKSHKPFGGSANVLRDVGFDAKKKCCNLWIANNFANNELVSDLTEEPPGFDLPRKQWSVLNRIRTLHMQG